MQAAEEQDHQRARELRIFRHELRNVRRAFKKVRIDTVGGDENRCCVSEFCYPRHFRLRERVDRVSRLYDMVLDNTSIYPLLERFVLKSPRFKRSMRGQNKRNTIFESRPECYETGLVPRLVDMNDIESSAFHCSPDRRLQVVRIGRPESRKRSRLEQVNINPAGNVRSLSALLCTVEKMSQ